MTSSAELTRPRPGLPSREAALLLIAAAGAWAATVALARGMSGMTGTMGLGLVVFLSVWTLMMAAMMLPSVTPFVSLYTRGITDHRAVRLTALTPCVYPMIAITVSYFGGQGGERNARRAFVSSLIYCLGIVLTYSTLGLIAALTGSLFGSALQSPFVLVGIALLLVALALSMFGLFELQPPQALMQKATGLSSKAGYIGVFFLGAVIGVIAAPCLAPFVVALLAFVGQTGNPWLGWWLFFALALGLGIPYVVLGTFSGLLTRLPKSGMWMVWVKRVFGVALFAVAAWIVSPLWQNAAGPTGGGIVWEPYSVANLQQAAAAHRPVMIDFTADWCGPCRKMQRTTFHDPRVIGQTNQVAMVRADLTRESSPEVEKIRKDFGIWGVPTILFLGPDGREHTELRQVEYIDANQLLGLLEKAKGIAPTNTPVARAPDVPPQLLNPF